jgi:hypothetical protein
VQLRGLEPGQSPLSSSSPEGMSVDPMLSWASEEGGVLAVGAISFGDVPCAVRRPADQIAAMLRSSLR